jgi:uncharacterized protein
MNMPTRADPLQYFRPNYFNLILLPTEACNFRCTYCYETFEHKKMSSRVVNGIKALIDRRAAGLDELDIGWFGGEPMLAFDIVTDICRHAIDVAKSSGFEFWSSMTTNGYFLDPKSFRTCLDNRIVSFQISLDGGPDDHNASRKLASGAGTFDRIWSNLVAMKQVEADFAVPLRLHYTFENFVSVGAFARKIADTFGADPRFHCYFRNISRLGSANDGSITLMSESEMKDIESHLWSVSGLPRPAEPDPHEAGYVCYAAKGHSLVVRSTGRLAKCTVALTQDYNDIGSIKENGDIHVDQERFRRWITPVLDQEWDIATCPMNWVAGQADMHDEAEASRVDA